MAIRKTRRTSKSNKSDKESRQRSISSAKASKAPVRRKTPAAAKSTAEKPSKKIEPLDLSAFPPESTSVLERWICLACIADVFTRHLALSPRTAHLEMKRYTPSIHELYAPVPARPWFANEPMQKFC